MRKRKPKIGRPPVDEPLDHLVQVRVTKAEYDLIHNAAEIEKRSMASFGRAAVIQRAEQITK